MSDILDKIVAVKREEIAAARRRRATLASLRRDAEALGGQRDFVGCAARQDRRRARRR